MRIAQLVVLQLPELELVEVDELPASERGVRGFGSSARVSAEPRLRVSALLRWNDGLLLCRHEKPGKEYWLLPGGGVNAGESLVDALDRELAEELGLDGVAVEGPVAICESIAPVQDPGCEARRPHRLRGRPLRRARSRRSPRSTRPSVDTVSSRSTSSTGSPSIHPSSASSAAGSPVTRWCTWARSGRADRGHDRLPHRVRVRARPAPERPRAPRPWRGRGTRLPSSRPSRTGTSSPTPPSSARRGALAALSHEGLRHYVAAYMRWVCRHGDEQPDSPVVAATLRSAHRRPRRGGGGRLREVRPSRRGAERVHRRVPRARRAPPGRTGRAGVVAHARRLPAAGG